MPKQKNKLPEEGVLALLAKTKSSPLEFLKTESLGALTRTSTHMRTISLEEMSKRLLLHVLRGEQQKAEQLIKKHPGLLNIRTSATDYSDRVIFATPYQAALGAKDTLMCKMMLPYFQDPEEIARQYKEQFPNGIEGEHEQAYDFEPIIAAIEKNENVDEVLEQFRRDMTSKRVIEHGFHFNTNHLYDAQAALEKHYARLGEEGGKLFLQKVIGFIQRQVPTVFAQAYSLGAINGYKTFTAKNRMKGLKSLQEFNHPWFPLGIIEKTPWPPGSPGEIEKRQLGYDGAFVYGCFDGTDLCMFTQQFNCTEFFRLDHPDYTEDEFSDYFEWFDSHGPMARDLKSYFNKTQREFNQMAVKVEDVTALFSQIDRYTDALEKLNEISQDLKYLKEKNSLVDELTLHIVAVKKEIKNGKLQTPSDVANRLITDSIQTLEKYKGSFEDRWYHDLADFFINIWNGIARTSLGQRVGMATSSLFVESSAEIKAKITAFKMAVGISEPNEPAPYDADEALSERGYGY